MALPGSVYLYQGEELGLRRSRTSPTRSAQDPMFARTGGANPGPRRLPRAAALVRPRPPFGFSPPTRPAGRGCRSPPTWAGKTVAAQDGDPGSMLELYRARCASAAPNPASATARWRWLDATPDVLAFARDDTFANVTNLGTAPAPLPPHREVLRQQRAAQRRRHPSPDASAWLRLS